MIIIFISLILSCLAWGQVNYNILSDNPDEVNHADSVTRATISRLEALIGEFTIDSLDIYIAGSDEVFDSLSGGSIPDWGVGVAIPYRHRIVIKSPSITTGDKSLGELVAHEVTHIALAHATGYRDLPRWFNEGMSMYLSTEWSWDDNLATSWAVVLGGDIELSDIERLNRFEGEMVRVAYSESYLAFKYFLDTYGKSSLNILLDRIKAGDSFDDAFIFAIGASHATFEKEFQTYLRGRYNLIALLFNSNLIWILLAFVVIIGFVIKRLNRKKRIHKLEEYEALHSTDFDYGEVEKPDEDKPWD